MKRLKLTAAAEVRAAELAEAHLNNNIAFVHVLSVTWVHSMPRFPLTDCSLSGSHMPAFKVDNKVWSVTLPAQLLWIHFIIKVNTSLVFPSKIFFHVWRMTWHTMSQYFHLSNYSVIYLTTLHLNNWHKALFSFGGGRSSPVHKFWTEFCIRWIFGHFLRPFAGESVWWCIFLHDHGILQTADVFLSQCLKKICPRK